MDDVDTFLEHFGVRGMKWGVRKKSGDGSVEAPASGKQRSDDSKAAGEESTTVEEARGWFSLQSRA